MTKLIVTYGNFCKVPISSIQRKITQALYTAMYGWTHTDSSNRKR